MKVLVTGATGFVGHAVVAGLLAAGDDVAVATRPSGADAAFGQGGARLARHVVPGLGRDTDWAAAVAGQAVVIHCAARVHVLRETENDALKAFREVNVEGTLRLARQAADAGVRRFVFLSSVGVHGSHSSGKPFEETDPVAPYSAYTVSKHEAEIQLLELARASGMEVVIVRPPLVYGPGAPGNFAVLMRWLGRGVPLPLGSVRNLRSYVSIANLVDFLGVCARHPGAANEVFLVSDGCDLSTPDLLARLSRLVQRPVRLLPVPVPVLSGVARLAGRPEAFSRLCASLRLDIGKARRRLGWTPPQSVDEGLAHAVRGATA